MIGGFCPTFLEIIGLSELEGLIRRLDFAAGSCEMPEFFVYFHEMHEFFVYFNEMHEFFVYFMKCMHFTNCVH
jgi:hypothetical protein